MPGAAAPAAALAAAKPIGAFLYPSLLSDVVRLDAGQQARRHVAECDLVAKVGALAHVLVRQLHRALRDCW